MHEGWRSPRLSRAPPYARASRWTALAPVAGACPHDRAHPSCHPLTYLDGHARSCRLPRSRPLGSRNPVARAGPVPVLALLARTCLRGCACSGGHTFPPSPARPPPPTKALMGPMGARGIQAKLLFSSFGSLPASPSAQLSEHCPHNCYTFNRWVNLHAEVLLEL